MNDKLKHTFELHHCIEEKNVFATNDMLQRLSSKGLYNVNDPRNLIYLPDGKPLGAQLGISPHVGGHLASYTKVVVAELDVIESGPDWQSFLENGDELAAQRVAHRVLHLEDTIKTALVNGDLYANNTANLSPRQVGDINTTFQNSVRSYQQVHTAKIDEIGKLAEAEAKWVGVLQSEQKIVDAAHMINRPGFKPAGDDAFKGHASLRDAINQAHAAGRLTVSEQATTQLRQAFAPHVAEADAIESAAARTSGRNAAAKSLVGVGVAVSLVDAADAGERTARSLAQDNPLAAQSQIAHYAGRGVGGWVGGAASGLAAGAWTGPGVVAFVVTGAVSGSYVGDKIAKMWDDHKIFNQEDRDKVNWKFNGSQWLRDQTADLIDDGVNTPVEQKFSALPEKARELSYKATNAATALALGDVDPPRNPYSLPAAQGDAVSLQRADWERNSVTGEWNRNVVVGFEQRGVPMMRPETATQERATSLNAASEQVIRENIANGQAPIAARYDLAYRAAGFHLEGKPLPAAEAALKDGVLTASDGKVYARSDSGQWQRVDEPATIAQGNLQRELESTRSVLVPQLAQHRAQAATIQYQPPTQYEKDERALISAYAAHGFKPNAEDMTAALEAIQRTREAQGVDAGKSSLALGLNAKSEYGLDSPIEHLRVDSAGVVRPAAKTSSEEIALAKIDLRGQSAPIPDTPELRIAALSPQQREAQEQALREANREGLSRDQVQHVAQHAAVQAASPATPRAEATPIEAQPARPRAPTVTLSDAAPVRERAFTAAPEIAVAAPVVELTPEPESRKPEPATQPEPTTPASPQPTQPLEPPQTRSEPVVPTAPATATNPPSAEPLTHAQDGTLRPGSQGQDVELLQYRLQRIGVRSPEGEGLAQTGQYDAATERAVRTFQRDQGMPETGIAERNDARRLHFDVIGQRTDAVIGQHAFHRAHQSGRRRAVAATRQDRHQHLTGRRAGRTGVQYVRVGAERVEDVSAFRSCDRKAFRRQLNAATEIRIAFEGGRDAARWVARIEHIARDVVACADVIQIGAGGIGQHAGLRRVVDALAEHQFEIGIFLQMDHRRIGVGERVKLRVQFAKLRDALRQNGFVIQRFHQCGRWKARQIDGGKGRHGPSGLNFGQARARTTISRARSNVYAGFTRSLRVTYYAFRRTHGKQKENKGKTKTTDAETDVKAFFVASSLAADATTNVKVFFRYVTTCVRRNGASR